MTDAKIGDTVELCVTRKGVVYSKSDGEIGIRNDSGLHVVYDLDDSLNDRVAVRVLERAQVKVIELSREELLVRRENIMRDLSAGYGCNPDLVDRLSEVDYLLGWPPDTKREPLVVQFGDSEPDRMKDFVGVDSEVIHYGISALGDAGWCVPRLTHALKWGELSSMRFPLTELTDSTTLREAAEITADSPEPDRTLKYVDASGYTWFYDKGWIYKFKVSTFGGQATPVAWGKLIGMSNDESAFPWTVKP